MVIFIFLVVVAFLVIVFPLCVYFFLLVYLFSGLFIPPPPDTKTKTMAYQPIPILVPPIPLLQYYGWILPSQIICLPLNFLRGRNLPLPDFLPLIITSVIASPPIEQYPHGNITDGIDWVDTEPQQGLQERSNSGNQIHISSSPYSHWLYSKPLSKPSPLPTQFSSLP